MIILSKEHPCTLTSWMPIRSIITPSITWAASALLAFSFMSSVQILFRSFIFPVGCLSSSVSSFWYLFSLCCYCQRSYGIFKMFLSESFWSVWQGFTIWGATLSPNPCPRTLWNGWISKCQSLTLRSLYRLCGMLWKSLVLLCVQCHFCCHGFCFFNYRQLFLPSWVCECVSRAPCRFLVFVILWYLGIT